MPKYTPNRPSTELDYGSVIFRLMMNFNDWARDSFDDKMENRFSAIHKLRALVLVLKAYLDPFARDEQYQAALEDIRYISDSEKFHGTMKDMDACMKYLAACIGLAFKYQLVQPYQEEVIDEIDNIRLSYTGNHKEP